MTTGESIRALRRAKGLTLKALAEKTGVSEATMARWEQGVIANPPREKLRRAAAALGVTEAELLGLSETGPVDPQLLLLMRQLQAMPEERRRRVIDMLRLLMGREME